MMMRPHVLVVDDSGIVRRVARRICEDLSFAVEEAEDGNAALDLCRRSMPDGVLVDETMPNVDGLVFTEQLRRLRGGEHPKVILLVAELDAATAVRARRSGVDQTILKPFDRPLLEDTLRMVGLL